MLAPPKIHPSTQYHQILNRMGWSMLIFLASFNTCTALSTSVLAMREFIESHFWYQFLTALYGVLATVCYMLPFFLTGLLYYVMSRKIRTERVQFEVKLPREFPLLIFAGLIILSAAAYVNSLFCSAIGYSIPADLIGAESYDLPSIVIQYMTVAIAPAFAEEFLFRGVFYTNLRPYGRTQAVLISSLLFALMHQNIGQLFYTFVAGIAMALMYELTGSIWCSVFFHLFNNQWAVISEVLLYGGYGEASQPFLSIMDAILFLLGILSIGLLILYYKRQHARKTARESYGIWGAHEDTVVRLDRPLPAGEVLKGALAPGMVVFTAVTVALMGATWLLLSLMNGGAM